MDPEMILDFRNWFIVIIREQENGLWALQMFASSKETHVCSREILPV